MAGRESKVIFIVSRDHFRLSRRDGIDAARSEPGKHVIVQRIFVKI